MLIVVPDMCRSPSWIQKSLGRAAFAAHCLMHPIELVFLARHVTGRAAAKGDVQLCRWVTPDVAFRMLWPRRADQLRGTLLAQHPQPVMVQNTGSSRPDLGSNRFANW